MNDETLLFTPFPVHDFMARLVAVGVGVVVRHWVLVYT